MLRRRFMMISGPGPEPPGPVYPTDGLMHEFTFDNGDLTDTGSSPVTATGSGVVGYPDGKVGKCVNLNRTTNVSCNVALPSNANTGARTFSVWFKRGTGYATSYNFYVVRGGSNAYVRISGTETRVMTSSNYYSTFTGGVATSNTSWHHIVVQLVTVSGSNCTVAVWLDGTKLTATRENNLSLSTLVNTAWRYLGINGTSSSVNIGYYDQYRVYNRVLTDAEIAQLYNSGQGV